MRSIFLSILLWLSIAGTIHASAIGILVNSTCEAGSCPPATLAVGLSATQSINYSVTLADGDMYSINGSFTEVNSGGVIAGAVNHAFQVTYEGNATGGASMADTINVEGEYALQTPLSSELIYRNVVGAFGPTIAATSSGTSCETGTTNGCVGTLHAPGAFDVDSANFTINSVAGLFDYDVSFASNFGAGSPIGAYIVWGQTTSLPTPAVATPEPTNVILFASGLVAILVSRICKTSSSEL